MKEKNKIFRHLKSRRREGGGKQKIEKTEKEKRNKRKERDKNKKELAIGILNELPKS